MTFEKARKTASTMIIVGIVISLFSMFTLPQGTAEYMIGGLIGVLLMAGAILICFVYCKCPHCGKRIMFQVLAVKKCPHCHKDVLKAPKKGRNKQRSDYGNNNVGPRL